MTATRKWLLRILALALLGALGGGYYLLQRWTNPQVVRQLVLEALGARLPGVEIRLARAELRLLGGISLYELRGALRNDQQAESFAVLPETIIYPDKEKLTRGQLGLRRVVFRRPTLNLIRQADGRWDLQDLEIPGGGSAMGELPPISIENATLLLQDHACAAPPCALRELNLEFLPCGPGQCSVAGQGYLDLVGPIRIEGVLNLTDGRAQVSIIVPGLVVTPDVMQRFELYQPGVVPHELALESTVEARLEVTVQTGGVPAVSCAARGILRQGRVQHPRLPGSVEQVEARWTFAGQRLLVEKFSGQFLGGTFEGRCEATTAGQATVKLQGRNWRVQPALYKKLPGELARLCQEYQPVGVFNGTAELSYQKGQLGFSYSAQPQELQILFEDLPYPVTQVKGSIEYHEPGGEPHMSMYLTGLASGKPVQLRGRLFGAGLRPDNDYKCGFDLELTGDDLPIDRTLEDALVPYPFTVRTLRQFHASGQFGFRAKLDRDAGTVPGKRPPLRKAITIHANKMTFKFDEFPYPMEQGQATLHIRSDDSWSFENFSATRNHGWVFGKGQMTPTPRGDELHVELRANNLSLEEPLREALPREAQEAWDQLRPTGRVDGDVIVDLLIEKEKPRIDLTVRPRGCSIHPLFLPCLLTQVEGSVRYCAQRIDLKHLTARHQAATLRVEQGKIELGPGERMQVELLPLTAQNLLIDDEIKEAVARLPRQTLETLQPDQPLDLVMNLILRRDQVGQNWKCGWNGLVDFKKCGFHAGLQVKDATGRVNLQGLYDGQRVKTWGQVHFAAATLLGQPLTNLRTNLLATDQEVKLTDCRAELHGGSVMAEVEAKLLEPIVYETRVRADQVDLGHVVQHAQENYTSVRGKLSAGLNLQGRGKELGALKGSGWVKVDNGAHLCELPVVLEIANHLHRLLPRATSFQDASALVRLDGENLEIERFDLMSDALSLRGQGRVKADGTGMNLELFGIPYGRTLPSLPPILDRIPPTLSKQILRIRATGTLSALQIHTEPLPSLVDPFKDMIRTFSEQPADSSPAPRQAGFDTAPPPGLQSPQ